MSLAEEMDQLLDRVQKRVDEALGEARDELREFSTQAEREWVAFRNRLAAAIAVPEDAGKDEPSQRETPPPPPESAA